MNRDVNSDDSIHNDRGTIDLNLQRSYLVIIMMRVYALTGSPSLSVQQT